MINCGAIVDLVNFLTLSETMVVYVFDSHRPFHLRNVRDRNQQVGTPSPALLCACAIPLRTCPPAGLSAADRARHVV
jgi:hypothetical protein